jgi:hypothetical protein
MGNNIGNIFFKYTPDMYRELMGYCRNGNLTDVIQHYNKHKSPIQRLRRLSRRQIMTNNRMPNNAYYNYALINQACIGGHLNIMMWLIENNIVNMNYICDKIYTTALNNYDRDIVSYLDYKYGNRINRGKICTQHMFMRKCLEGNIEIAEYILNHSNQKHRIYASLQRIFNTVCDRKQYNVAKFIYNLPNSQISLDEQHVYDIAYFSQMNSNPLSSFSQHT